MKKYTHFKIEFTVEGDGKDPLPSPSAEDFLVAMSGLLKKTCPSVEAILPGLRVRIIDRTALYRRKHVSLGCSVKEVSQVDQGTQKSRARK